MIRTQDIVPDWVYHLNKIADSSVDTLLCKPLVDVTLVDLEMRTEYQNVYSSHPDLEGRPLAAVPTFEHRKVRVIYNDHAEYNYHIDWHDRSLHQFRRYEEVNYEWPMELNKAYHNFDHVSNMNIYMEKYDESKTTLTYVVFFDLISSEWYCVRSWHTRIN